MEETPRPKEPKGGKKKKQPQRATVEDEDDDTERHIAQGAITRVRRRRKEWARRSRDMDDEPRAATYNLHLGPNGTSHSDIPGILLGCVSLRTVGR